MRGIDIIPTCVTKLWVINGSAHVGRDTYETVDSAVDSDKHEAIASKSYGSIKRIIEDRFSR